METFDQLIEAAAERVFDRKAAPLAKKIERLYKLVPADLKHKAAYEFLEISDQALRRERDRPGTLIRYRMEGEGKRQTPVYNFASLIEYADSKYLPVLKAA